MKLSCLLTILFFSLLFLKSNAQQRLVPVADGSTEILPHMVGFNNQMASKNEPWNDAALRQALSKSNVGLLRYPGGTVSNYWDMEYQRLFKNAVEIDTSETNPRTFLKTENVIGWVVPFWPALNSVSNLKQAYAAMAGSHTAEPAVVFVLNLITPGSDFYAKKWGRTINEEPLSDDWWAMMNDRLVRNLKMLEVVIKNGMKVKYIEFGNEYYFGKSTAGNGENGGSVVEPYSAGSSNTELTGAFPDNGKSYADAVNNWADTLHKLYPEVRLCAIASVANSANPSRRNSWNKEVIPYIDKEKVPAVSLHVYNGVDEGNLKSGEENLGKAFSSWLKHWEWIKNNSFLPADREFWYTEYNSNQDKKTWGHGLMNLFNIHTWLKEGNLGLTNYHQFAQNSVTGSGIFASTRTFSMLAKATRGKNFAKELIPGQNLFLEGTGEVSIPSIMAWQFKAEKETDFTYFLSNFSSKEIEFDLAYIAGASGSYYYYAQNSLANTTDLGEKFGKLGNVLKIPAYTCLYFSAGDIVPVRSKQLKTKSEVLKIYPNPGNKLILEYEPFNPEILSFSIIDITGKTIFEIKDEFNQIQREALHQSLKLKSGVYIVRLIGANFMESKRWIKK